ncbi:MAG: hypothetical protein Q7S87_18200 [Agitococcus sp.]|nr:hypothetical protein [Agitococcus sp.]
MTPLELHPGGKLIHNYWVYDDTLGTGVWAHRDVSARAGEFLFAGLTIRSGVTFADVFTLLSVSPVLLTVFRQDYAMELCVEAQKGLKERPGEPWERIETIELYRVWSVHTGTREYEGVGQLYLHGLGPLLAENIEEHGHIVHKQGDRITWGLTLTPVRELLNLPITLRAVIPLCENDLDAQQYGAELARVTYAGLTLGELIHTLLSEISFHGTPSQTQAVCDELHEQVDHLLDTCQEGNLSDKAQLTAEPSIFDDSRVYDYFFEAWRSCPAKQLSAAIRELDDNCPIEQGLQESIGEHIRVKNAYAQLPSRAFRKHLREWTEAHSPT